MTKYLNKIINGDSLDVMKKMESNSIDLIATDPPYQLASITARFGKEGSAEAKHGVDGSFRRVSKGFMGKTWDVLPTVELLEEALRVLKPGGWSFWMCSTRQDSLAKMITRLSKADFEVGFSSIYWSYASGLPKTTNTYEMAKKRGRDDEGLKGSKLGFQPKPAVEVIIVAMKPLEHDSYIDQALDDKKGVTWIDECAIPTDDVIKVNVWDEGANPFGDGAGKSYTTVEKKERFPANILSSDGSLDSIAHGKYSRYFSLDAWWDKRLKKLPKTVRDSFPFMITPKPSRREKNKGCEKLEKKESQPAGLVGAIKKGDERPRQPRANYHPTIKPVKLFSWLITLGSRRGDVVLDPFCGSGTTCISALIMGRKYIGIEKEEEYCQIAEARLDANWQMEL